MQESLDWGDIRHTSIGSVTKPQPGCMVDAQLSGDDMLAVGAVPCLLEGVGDVEKELNERPKEVVVALVGVLVEEQEPQKKRRTHLFHQQMLLSHEVIVANSGGCELRADVKRGSCLSGWLTHVATK